MDVKFLDCSVFKNRIQPEFRFSAHPYYLCVRVLKFLCLYSSLLPFSELSLVGLALDTVD